MRETCTKRTGLKTRAFTLVELLVVITIIGILVGMLMPAISSARESARKLQCANNIKQLATAILAHEEAQGFYPTGGWGWFWVGDPDRGYARNQPGGWFYNILPNLEQTNLHDLGRGGSQTAKKAAMIQLARTPQPMMGCPTRRRSVLYEAKTTLISHYGGDVHNTPNAIVARGDYAINVGDTDTVEVWEGPNPEPTTVITKPWHDWGWTGISYECSIVRQADVTDGPSNMIMLGEKFVPPDRYGNGQDAADNENIYVGMDNDVYRGTHSQPLQDRLGVYSTVQFGSAHIESANYALCDGSTRTINYAIDINVFRALGNRNDGAAVDTTKL